MNDEIVVLWQQQAVGTMQQYMPDMWYLEGHWQANASPLAEAFEATCRQVTPKDFFAGKAPRIDVLLTDHTNSYRQPAVVVGLVDGLLHVRRIFS